MISYKIIVQHNSDQHRHSLPVKRVMPGDADYEQVVFQRTMHNMQYNVGDRVKVRRTPRKGVITSIERDIKKVNWFKHRPMPLTITFDDGETLFAHPSQIKRTK